MKSNLILNGIVDASKITQSELAIMNYAEQYNIPVIFHFYSDPIIGGIGFLMHIDIDIIEFPERFDIDPAIGAILIGLALASNIDTDLLKALNDIKLITRYGIYLYDPILIADNRKEAKNALAMGEYSKMNLNAVKELTYFIHGSHITALNKETRAYTSGFPIFDYDDESTCKNKFDAAFAELKEVRAKKITVKIISSHESKFKVLPYLCETSNKYNILLDSITFNYIKNYNVIEVYLTKKEV